MMFDRVKTHTVPTLTRMSVWRVVAHAVVSARRITVTGSRLEGLSIE